jgi:hypothetical protein
MSIERVHFREQQILTHSDLSDEQTYLIAMRRRHNLAHHRWGIVQGLELELVGDSVFLYPGFAVDGYGRELVVPTPVSLSATELDGLLSEDREVIDFWLTYRLLDDPADNSRAREEAWLKLVHVDPNEPKVDPRHPPWVPASDWEFRPHQEPQDDPEKEWPVYLGRIRFNKSEGRVTLELLEEVERPYASLLGWRIVAPWRDQWLQIGNEYSGDNKRFAVSLPDTVTGNNTDRWVIDNKGDTTLRGTLQLAPLSGTNFGKGNLHLLSAATNQAEPSGIEFAPLDVPPAQAASWQIYAIAASQQQNLHAQLRFEIANPGQKQGDPEHYEWVIGSQDQASFNPLLSVRADGTVVINGDLTIKGQFIQGPIQADIDDERFQDELLKRWTGGLTRAGGVVDASYKLELKIGIIAPSSVPSGQSFTYTVEITNTSPPLGIYNSLKITTFSAEFTDQTAPISLTPPDSPLERGQSYLISADYASSQRGRLLLTVTVTAASVTGDTVKQQESKEIQVVANTL